MPTPRPMGHALCRLVRASTAGPAWAGTSTGTPPTDGHRGGSWIAILALGLAGLGALGALSAAPRVFAQPAGTDPAAAGAAAAGTSTGMPPTDASDADAKRSAGAEGSAPGSPEAQFRSAGEAYEAGRFDEAVEYYQRLLDEGYDDARIHYNLGNARFKQGRLGLAILGYERALARNPSDPDARENLAFANLLTSDKVGSIEEEFPARVLDALDLHFGPNRAIALFTIFCLLAGAIGVPVWFIDSRGFRRVLLAGVGVALAGAILCGGIAALEIASPGHEAYAVVLASSTDGRSSPSADGTVLFTVHEGLKVEVRGERSGWIQVALPNGLAGWIESAHAERI